MHVMSNPFAVSIRAVLLGGAALALPAVAFAQTPAPAAEGYSDGNEIIVTATKREQTLQDVPVAVSVTTADTIERAQIRDIKDLASVVPSLRVNQLQSSANTNFYIRGFGNGANNAGIEPSVGLFIDGVYRSRSASMIADLPDIQRVEVLRGPQSTLFGKNASAGVISIVTREPQFKFGGNVEATYGNFDAMTVKGVVTGPIAESVAFSLAGSWNKRDGFIRDEGTGDRTNERNRWMVRGQLLFEPSSDLKIRLIGDYGKIDENCCAVVNIRQSAATAAINAVGGRVNAPGDKFDDVIYSNRNSTNEIENWGVSGQIDWNVGDVKLSSITSYRRTNAVTDQDSDFTSAELLRENFQDLRIKTFTQEFRATTDFDGPLNGLIGGFYFNERIKQDNRVNWGSAARPYANLLVMSQSGCGLAIVAGSVCPTAGGPTPVALEPTFGALEGNPLKYIGQFYQAGTGLTENYGLKNESYSLFGQLDFKVTDRLTLTGGVNYTHDRKRFATNTFSSDVFARDIDFNAPQYAPFRTALLVQGALAQGLTLPQAQAFAAGEAAPGRGPRFNDPLVNPLNPLKQLQYFPGFQNLPNAVEDGKISGGDFSFTARLAYDVSDTLNVYAAYATGYKAASVNLSRDSRPTPADLTALQQQGLAARNLTSGTRFANPEDSTVYEAGIKGNWGVASANVAVFKQSIKGFQSNIFTGSGFALANAGKQSAFGIEFEGTVKPVKPLTLGLSMTYLDPKFDSFTNSALGDISGSMPAGVSPLSVTFSGQYDHEMGNGDRIILRGDYHYEAPFKLVEGLPGLVVRNAAGQIVSNTAAIAAAKEFEQDINDVNASLTYAMANGLEVSVWGRNLLNDRTLLQVFDSPAQPGSLSGYPNQPRTYGVSARFRW